MDVRNDIDVSAIILTWNSQAYIKKCVESIIKDATDSDLNVEIILIDNGSTDETVTILENLKANSPIPIQIIKLEKNFGTTEPRNMGIKRAKGKYLLVIDSDTMIPKSGVLSELINFVERDEKIGILAPRLLYPDGTVQESCKKFPTIINKLFKSIPIEFLKKVGEVMELYDNKIYTKQFTEPVCVDYCISAAWLINRKALDEVGLFDENIFYSPEDVDLCLRMWLNGWKVVYYPKCIIIHYTQRLSYKNKKIAFSHIKGLMYYFNKHKYWISRSSIYRKINFNIKCATHFLKTNKLQESNAHSNDNNSTEQDYGISGK